GRRLHSRRRGALSGQDYGRHQLSLHFSPWQTASEPHSHGGDFLAEYPDGQSLSLAFNRSNLYFHRQRHVGERQTHPEIRVLLGAIRRKRQRRDQRQRMPALHHQQERTVFVPRNTLW